MTRINELRDQGLDELEVNLNDNRKKLFELRNERKRTKKLGKPHLVKETKKDIARLMTAIQEKKIDAAKS